MKLKQKIYQYLVESNEHIKSHYEGYIISNPEEHHNNPIQSYKFLFSLRKYYKNGQKGAFPSAPKPYIEKNAENPLSFFSDFQSSYELIRQSSYFDEDWYYKNYPDVIKSGTNAANHYLNIGWKEFRRPGPSFSTLLYLNRYDDVNSMQINPLLHYELYGKQEKRVSSYQGLYKQIKKDIDLLKNSIFFDADWYTRHYLQHDVTKEIPVVHYYCIGCYLGMEPGPLFDSKLFEKEYPQVKSLIIPYLLYYEAAAKTMGNGYISKSTNFYSNLTLRNRILHDIYNVTVDMLEQGALANQNKVLLISHMMNLTGAPRVCLNMALALKKLELYPVIMTFKNGSLGREAEEYGIPVIEMVCYEKPHLCDDILRFVNQFDYILYNTVESLKLAHIFQFTKAKKIGWFHEGNETLKLISEKQITRANLLDEIYFGSPYCHEFWEPYINDSNRIETLLYGIDSDYIKNISNSAENLKAANEKIIFAVVGSIGYRKGTDLLLEAIQNLSEDLKQRCEFWIIGNVIDEEVGIALNSLLDKESCIRHWDAIPYEALISFEKSCDILLCPAIDDPLPAVVTEAMILRKPVIISSNVGTAYLVENNKSALIFKSGCIEELMEKIESAAAGKYDLQEIANEAYAVYTKYLSMESFERNVKNIFSAKNETTLPYRSIDNLVTLHDLLFDYNGVTFVFSCDEANELYMMSEGTIYTESTTDEKAWQCFHKYLTGMNKRLALIKAGISSLNNFSAIVGSNVFDTVDLKAGDYSWLRFNQLARKQDICISFSANTFKFTNKDIFFKQVMSSNAISAAEKNYVKKVSCICEFPYNIYTETRDNGNDNAYTMFLYDLKTNDNAYFITTKAVYQEETDEYIKQHLLILNSPKAKAYMLRAKNIIVSWHATPIFGYDRMTYLYPFIRMNYIFVPHGISYDKDSYYLHRSNWGYFSSVICCSKYEKQYLEQCNHYENVAVLGYPRMDKWYDAAIEDKQIFLFPSWRDDMKGNYMECILQISETIAENLPDYQLVYAAHPSIEKDAFYRIASAIRQYAANAITFMCTDIKLFNQFFASARYLITDYSSAAYDFAYKGNCISIYYSPFYDENNHYHFHSEFYEHHCGIMVNNSEELLDALKNKEIHNEINRRRNDFFETIDKNNTARVMNLISRGDKL